MAEETQEELSMEDILSSIKDILMDDNASQQLAKADDVADVVSDSAITEAKEKVAEDVEDVLDLSPSMIVAAEEKTPTSESDNLDFDAEFEDLPSEPSLDDIDETFALSKIADDANSSVEAEVAPDPIENFTINDPETLSVATEELALPEISFEEDVVDVEAEPIYSQEDDALSKENGFGISETKIDDLPFDDATLDAILNDQPSDPIIEDEENFVEPTDNTYEAVIEHLPEPVIETAPKEAVIATEVSEVGEVSEVANTDDAVDLSASIINNFAKMFADSQEEKSADLSNLAKHDDLTSRAMEKINLGNGNLTIEAIVRDVVTDIVEKNLQTDYNFATTASEEIAKQTKIWLNANLPSIVEATVQKEIERVMAKVSS